MKKRKILSMFLAAAMVLSLLPVSALADSSTECQGGDNCTHDAAIGNTHYDTLAEAVAAVHEKTGADRMSNTVITLLRDASGGGIGAGYESISDGTTSGNNPVSFTLDLDGHTYTVKSPAVGSSGTETNGFQLLEGSVVVIKNGNINSSLSNNILIQNYSDLTLEDVNLTATDAAYVLSDNCGDVNIKGSTSITAGSEKVAFDVCGYTGYSGVTVTVDTTGTITGKIELTRSSGNNNQVNLNIQNGNFVGKIDKQDDQASITITGGTFSTDVSGYVDLSSNVTKDDNGNFVIAPNTKEDGVAEIGGKYYKTLGNAIASVGDGDTIQVLKDIPNAEGISVPSGKNFTIDFGGHTYTLTGPGAGSSNTETNGFQLLKDSAITMKNGTIRIAENANNIKRMVQNYADLTLENMQFYAENQVGGEDYALSFNNGNVTFKGNTSVFTTRDDTVAFDVYYWAAYYPDGIGVTFAPDYTGTVNGVIMYDSTDDSKAALTIQGNGTFGGVAASSGSTNTPNIAISGGTFPAGQDYIVPGMEQDEDGKIVIDTDTAEAEINGVGYTSLDAALEAAKAMTGDVTITLIDDANLTDNFAAAKSNNISYDLSDSNLTSLTICGASQNIKIISGVNGNDIDVGSRPFCPKINVTLPADAAAFTVKNLTFPNDLQFDSNGGTVVIQNCVLNGSISGYPQAKSISYLNNTFEFKGTANNFHSGNAYPVWYKLENEKDFVFTGNTVKGYRGVHIETRDQADIRVDNNRFELADSDYANKAIALQLVGKLNGQISFQNNYVDAYMAICFYKDLEVVDGAALAAENNYLVGDCKLYGSSEWNQNMTASDDFAQSIIDKLTGTGSTVTPGHTDHNYVDGVCIICGQSEPTSSTSYAITVDKTDNGTVTASRTRANKGLTVTLTVKADEGYVLASLTVTDKDGNEVKLTDKGDGKYTFAMPASKVTVKAVFAEAPVASGLPFTDVDVDDWFYQAVYFAYSADVMHGVSGTLFAPNTDLTRAMIAQMFYNLEGGVPGAPAAFDDVASDAWYADAVNWAASTGIVAGFGNGIFGPDEPITREQLAVIIYRYAQFKGAVVPVSGDLSAFNDGDDVSDWAADAMTWAVQTGLIAGMGNNTLSPQGTATRAQVATILMRFITAMV